MSNSFTQVFGGTTIYPADVSYLALALTGNISLEWPLEATAGSSVVARIIDITPSGAYTITMPEATSVSVGQTVLFNNIGPSTVAVNKANGSAILSIGAGEQWQAYLIDNTTPGGTWRTLRYGAATAQAQAAALAGPGLVTDGSQLAQNYEVIDFSVTPYTLTAPDRAKVFIWDGGLGTLNLPSAPAAGDGWFVQVRNAGQGDLTVDPSGSELINAGSTLLLQPGDSAVIVSNGTQWYTIGLGQQAVFAFDYTSIAVTGGTYTLSGSELNRIAYKFTGALASNVTIVVPATVQQYWVNNSTTGPFTLSLQASGSGSSTPVTQSSTSILYCDGTAIVPATTAVTFAGILPVSQGGTGANNAPSARTNLGATGIGSSLFTATSAASARSTISAASSGANSDITSLSGLTTPLSVGQGGTGAATLTANGVVVGNGTSAVQVTAAGTTGQVLVGNTGGAPSWATLSGIGVTSFSGGTTGLTPASPTTGAITLAGTLGVANGGTGVTSSTGSGSVVLSNSPTLVTPALGAATATSLTLTKLALTVDSPFYTGGNISSGANNLAIGTTGATVFGIFTNNNERMRIDSSGNVGIATSSPTALLTVNGTAKVGEGVATNTSKFMVNTLSGVAAGIQLIQDANESWIIQNPASTNVLTFSNSGTERMRIDASGNVGIGTAIPASYGKLAVRGNINASTDGATLLTMRANANATDLSAYNATGAYLAFQTTPNGGGELERMRITSAGDVGIGTSSPSAKLDVNGTGYFSDNVSIVRTNTAGSLTGLTINNAGTSLAYAGVNITSGTVSSQLFNDAAGNAVTTGTILRTTTNHPLVFGTNNTDRMRIDSAGLVGIGNLFTPIRGNLDISLGNITTAGVERSIHFGYSTADFYGFKLVNINSPGSFGAGTFSIQRGTTAAWVDTLFINNDGNVGIGTTNPTSKLYVEGTIQARNGSTGILIFGDGSGAGYIDSTGAGNPLIVLTNGTEKMRITDAGNVGIGTSSPSNRLHVYETASQTVARFESTLGSSFITLHTGSAQTFLGSDSTGAFLVQTPGSSYSTKMFVGAAGNVGIGTASPVDKLHVSGSASFFIPGSTDRLVINPNAAGSGVSLLAVNEANNAYRQMTIDGVPVVINAAGTEAMRITSAGSVGIGTASPTVRLQVESLAPYQAYFKGTDAAGAGGIRTLNSGGTAGVALLTYGPSYVGGSIGSIGANGSAVVQTGAAPLFIGTDAGVSQPLYLGTNGSERMRIDTSGNVMIGTTAANNKFLVTYANPVSVPAAGAGGHCAAFGTVGYGLATGALTNGNAYLQATRWDTIATNYDLLLQPNGGNVGIGTASPVTRLEVVGNQRITKANVGYEASMLSFSTPSETAAIYRMGMATGGNFAIGRSDTATTNITLDSVGNVGIGTSAPVARLHVVNSSIAAQLRLQDVLTDATTKYGVIGSGHYTNAEEPFLMAMGVSSATSNTLSLGGGSTSLNAATEITFLTAANNTTTTGTERMRIDSSGNLLVGTTGNLNTTAKARVYQATGDKVMELYSNSASCQLTLADNANLVAISQNSGLNLMYNNAGTLTTGLLLNHSGNVGIGTTSPNCNLEVFSSPGGEIRFGNVSGTGRLIANGAATYIGSYSNHPVVFQTAQVEKMRLDTSGNLLVGTTTAVGIVSAVKDGGDIYYASQTAAGGYCYTSSAANNGGLYYHMLFSETGTARGTITSNGSTVSYNTSSDERLKHDIVNAPEASSLIDAIKVRSFKWNADNSEQRYGFVAQELLTVAPEAVSVPADPDDMMGVDYSKLVPMLVKEIQSLRARVAQLEGK